MAISQPLSTTTNHRFPQLPVEEPLGHIAQNKLQPGFVVSHINRNPSNLRSNSVSQSGNKADVRQS